MNGEWITVAEFAERANISKQAVYQQLNKKLKPYLTVMDGAKMLNIKALEEVYGKTEDKEVESDLNKKLVNQLIDQLEEKDRQIAELHRLLATSQMQLTESEHRRQMIEEKMDAQEEQPEDADPDEEIEPDTEKVEKKSWWKKIFKV